MRDGTLARCMCARLNQDCVLFLVLVDECVTLWRGISSACMQVWRSRNVRVHFFTSPPHSLFLSDFSLFALCLVVFIRSVCVLVVNFASLYCCYFKFHRRRRRRLPFEEKFIISLRLITTFRKKKNKNKKTRKGNTRTIVVVVKRRVPPRTCQIRRPQGQQQKYSISSRNSQLEGKEIPR